MGARGTDFHCEKERREGKKAPSVSPAFFSREKGGGYSFKVALGCCMLASSDEGNKKKSCKFIIVIFATKL